MQVPSFTDNAQLSKRYRMKKKHPSPHLPQTPWLILFDGICGWCTGWVRFLIHHDTQKRLQFSPLQSPLGQQQLEKYHLSQENFSTFVVIVQMAISPNRRQPYVSCVTLEAAGVCSTPLFLFHNPYEMESMTSLLDIVINCAENSQPVIAPHRNTKIGFAMSSDCIHSPRPDTQLEVSRGRKCPFTFWPGDAAKTRRLQYGRFGNSWITGHRHWGHWPHRVAERSKEIWALMIVVRRGGEGLRFRMFFEAAV
jgi:hypothetical protein